MTRISKPDGAKTATATIKFLYSYGGKIMPRRNDVKLCYVGGFTRVLSVPRSVSYSELMVKFTELCGSSMTLKCKLPYEDLDVLISIRSDEDLQNVIEEYDLFSAATHKEVKITAVLFPITSLKKITPVSSAEDLCSTASHAKHCAFRASLMQRDSARATWPNHVERRMAYRHQHNRCRIGGSPAGNMCFLPTNNTCR